MIPRLQPDLRLNDLAALVPSRNQAQDVRRFENAFAELSGHRHAFAFPLGRTALMAILAALDKPGGEVICPSYTCVVVAHAIVKAGLTPVFVDSSEADYNMDWEFVAQATGPKTTAVVATSIFGHPVNGPEFNRYRRDFPDIPIIQDCAHGFLAGNSHQNGLAAFYGLNVSKIITSVFGGMITTDNDDLAKRLLGIRDTMVTSGGLATQLKRSFYLVAVMAALDRRFYGIVNRLERMQLLNRFVKYYDPGEIDLPADAFTAMGGLEARIGLRQCARYQDIVNHRRDIATIYHRELAGTGNLLMPPQDPDATVSHFVIRTKRAAKIKALCLHAGVQLGELIDYDVIDLPAYRDAIYFGEHRARVWPSEVINLPVHMGVSQKDAKRISAIVLEAIYD